MRFRILVLFTVVAAALGQTRDVRVQAPRFWNDRELSDLALPVAGLNVRPGHFLEKEYYAAPDAEWVRPYPVYFPGREPAGYRDSIRQKKAEPLITPGARTMRNGSPSAEKFSRKWTCPSFAQQILG